MAARSCLLLALLSLGLSVLTAGAADLLVVNVTADGHDRPECLRGLANCSTLGYALRAIANASLAGDGTEINVWYDHAVNDSTRAVEGAVDVSVIGRGGSRRTVTCEGLGNGLGFNHSRNITVIGVSWVNCSLLHPTTANISTYPLNHTAYSALFLYNCTNLVIRDCTFSSAFGSGVSLFNVAGAISIEWSNFTDNNVNGNKCPESVNSTMDDDTLRGCSPQATGLYIEFMYCENFSPCEAPYSKMSDTSYSISHCNFERNVNPQAFGAFTTYLDRLYFWPFGTGGGLAIVMRSYVVANNTFAIQHCNFNSNRALWAGGVIIDTLSDNPYNNTVSIEHCNFTNNYANFSGGAVRVGMIQLFNGVHYPPNVVQLNSVLFTSNNAAWGGGLSIYVNPTEQVKLLFNASSCGWCHNNASNASSAVGITRWNEQTDINVSVSEDLIFFTDCRFVGNMLPMPLFGKTKLHGFGAVYTDGVPIIFKGQTHFHGNRASALFISSTAVIFYDHIDFTNGHAIQGGGIHLTGSSWITLTPGVNIHFINNTALQTGGAIHYTFPPSLALWDSLDCFLRYYDQNNAHVPLKSWSINITFTDNFANGAGHAIYITNSFQCVWPIEQGGDPFNSSRSDKLIYHQNQTSLVVATSPRILNFSSESNSLKKVNNWWSYSISPGEPFDLFVTAMDHYDQVIPSAVFTVTCESLSDYTLEKFSSQRKYCNHHSDSDYEIDGGKVYASNTTMSGLRITAPPSNSSDLILLFITFGDYLVIGTLQINFVPCKFGMTYHQTSHKCKCEKSQYWSCLEEPSGRQTPCLPNTYWYGNISNAGNTSKFGIKQCPEWACKPCEDYCDNFNLSCKVPSTSNGFCYPGRTGILCSQCSPPLALTYDAYNCSNCSAGHKAGLALLIVAYWTAVVVEIVLLVKFNVAMGSAGVYGILYFYSVVGYIVPTNFPLRLGLLFYVLSAFTQLNPYFLSYTNFCLFDSATNVHYQAIHFIHPIAISLMLYALYRIDRVDFRCCRMKFLAGESATPAVCILILVSYTSIAGTALHLLDPLTYIDPLTDSIDSSQVFVQVQPSTPYMDSRGHLPFALIAILAELVLVIPFTVFMLISPRLEKHINFIKIKPFLDGFQSCYRDRHRYFAGVYLLARQFFFLTSLSAIDHQLSIYLRQLISLLLLALHGYIQPYQKQWLNFVDLVILTDISLLTFTVATVSETGFQLVHQDLVRDVFVILLAFSPVAYIIAAIIHRLYRKYKCKFKRLTSANAPSINDISPPQESDGDLPPLRSEEGGKPARRTGRGERGRLLPGGSAYKSGGSTSVTGSVSVPRNMEMRHVRHQSTAAPLLKTALTD